MDSMNPLKSNRQFLCIGDLGNDKAERTRVYQVWNSQQPTAENKPHKRGGGLSGGIQAESVHMTKFRYQRRIDLYVS